jgi:hypothetical protein
MQQLEAQSVRQAVRIPRGLRTTGRTLKTGLALREGRRNANRGTRLRLLRCECDQPGCKAQLPSSAERYRRSGIGERFLVVPRHIGTDTVVAAADSFFVVELERATGTW